MLEVFLGPQIIEVKLTERFKARGAPVKFQINGENTCNLTSDPPPLVSSLIMVENFNICLHSGESFKANEISCESHPLV